MQSMQTNISFSWGIRPTVGDVHSAETDTPLVYLRKKRQAGAPMLGIGSLSHFITKARKYENTKLIPRILGVFAIRIGSPGHNLCQPQMAAVNPNAIAAQTPNIMTLSGRVIGKPPNGSSVPSQTRPATPAEMAQIQKVNATRFVPGLGLFGSFVAGSSIGRSHSSHQRDARRRAYESGSITRLVLLARSTPAKLSRVIGLK